MAEDYTFSSELFFDELLHISSNIVWKNSQLALENEDPQEIAYIEDYILSRQGRLSFNLIEQFEEDVLRSLGIDDDTLIVQYMNAKETIPENLKELAVQRQMEYIIDTYDEPNNYYRMLNGLPNKEEGMSSWIYNTEYPEISPANIPIHELDSSQLYALESKGYIDKIIEENPTKKYLHHLTDRKIDIYNARQSDSFAILWITPSDYPNLMEDFVDTYNECKYMITNVFYQKIMMNSNEYYTGFIGLMILFQTILQMHRKFLDTDITRDFYDEDSLRQVYDSYDVPFFSSIPIEFHRKIVKNINILLSHKGSTKVFYDLFEIFDLDDMAVFEFYMLKLHRFKNGKPVFYYNEDGSLNERETYEIKFGKVKLYNDPITEIQESKNQMSYDDIIRNDPYWINDKDLIDKLYSEDFNYVESKYLGIQTTFNLMKIIYETSYYIKMLLDNREKLSYTTVYNQSIRAEVNIFDLVIYLSALITKKYGFEGNIPTDIHEIGKVMGFNFQEDLIILKNNISENDYLKNDPKLIKYLETMEVYSLESISKVYKNLTDLRKYLVSKFSETDDVNVYWAYYELYQTIMYSEYTEETFQKSNGNTAESFADLLHDINPTLYNKYNMLENTDLDQEVSDSLYLLKSSCTKLSYIQYADNINIDTLIEYLFKLLEFFKSAKADLTGYEIVFSLISSADNIIKFMNIITKITDDHTSDPQYSIIDELTDLIWLIKDRMRLLSQYKLEDELMSEKDKTLIQSKIDYLHDVITRMCEEFHELVSSYMFIESLSVREIFLPDGDRFPFEDRCYLLWEEIMEVVQYHLEDEFPIQDDLMKLTDICRKNINSQLPLTDKLYLVYEETFGD